jgi:hypothetical protein
MLTAFLPEILFRILPARQHSFWTVAYEIENRYCMEIATAKGRSENLN